VRGQRLLIRPREAADAAAIAQFFALHGHEAPAAETAIVGKLVGDLVAVAAFDVTPEAVRLRDLFVAPDLRRKRIGRFMVDELAKRAGELGRECVIVEAGEQPGSAGEFFRKVGFVRSEERWERRVR
jgi:GNAT superfamily N-acetyltransferase